MIKTMKAPLFILLFACSICLSTSANGQAPYISSLSQSSGYAGETISISGLNFTGITSVKFGGTNAQSFTVVSENLIQAVVPSGATYDNVIVSSNGGQAISSQIFNLTYSGSQPSISDLKNTFEEDGVYLLAATDAQTQDLCLCDFDRDGKVDIAVTNGGDVATTINIYRNTSVIGAITLDNSSGLNINVSKPTLNLRCADLNNDGLADLVATEGGTNSNELFIFQNTTAGTISFNQVTPLELPRTSDDIIRSPSKIALKDLDLDGNTEIIVTNSVDNILDVYNNTSTSSSVSFGPSPSLQLVYTSEDDSGLNDIVAQDLNNDNLPDLAITASGAGLIVFRNTSSPSEYSFEAPQKFETATQIQRIQTGDFNQDSFQDIVISNNNNTFEILLNLTSGVAEELNFSSKIGVSNVSKGWGVDLGDIDGDGDLDLAFGSNGTHSLFLSLLSDVNSINNDNIASTAIALGSNSRNIKLSDLDGDGKVDVVFTHNSYSTEIGNIGIIRNKLCITPEISPSTEVQICNGGSTVLSASGNPDLTYEWLRNGVIIAGASTQNYTATMAGSYTVKVEDECKNESTPVVVTQNGALFTAPTFDAISAICSGTPITFNLSGGTGSSFAWTGPGDYTSTDKNPTISDPEAGEYTIVVTSSDGCLSDPQSRTLSVIQVPTIAIRNEDTDEYCADNSSRVTLERSDFGSSEYTYEWLDESDAVVGSAETFSPTATASAGTASYRAKIISKALNSCSYETPSKTIRALSVPEAAFTSDDSKCIDQDIQFTATTTGESGFEVNYSWDYGDSQTEEGTTETSPTHSYNSETGSPFTVQLSVAYTQVDNCVATAVSSQSKSITITTPPTGSGLDLIVSQNTDPENFEKCPSGAITLELANTYSTSAWKAKLNTEDVYTPFGTSDTQTMSDTLIVVVDLTDSDLCSFTTNSIKISNLQNSGFSIETDATNEITSDSNLGKIIHMNENQESVSLFVSSDITAITWSPLESLTNEEDVSKNNINIFPNSIQEKILITATDGQSCIESDSVTLLNEFIKADEAFTPNGDGTGDCWEISNAGSAEFATCTISIFDIKGRRIMNQTGPFDSDCVWDGNSENGDEIPNGIYYYVMNCDQSETTGNVKGSLENGGSILLVR